MTTPADPSAIQQAADAVRAGSLVAFPTDTVYALGASALDKSALGALYAAKRRSRDQPFAVLVADEQAARALAASWPDRAGDLARRFWPGPLTIIVPAAPHLPEALLAGGQTVGLRCPQHETARELLRAAGPLAASSANPARDFPAMTAAAVRAAFPDEDIFVLDAPAVETSSGLESTVLRLADSSLEPDIILRQGAISAVDIGGDVTLATSTGKPVGAKDHRTFQVKLFERGKWRETMDAAPQRTLFIAPNDNPIHQQANARTIALPDEAGAYSARLYLALEEARRTPAELILIEYPESQDPLWDAIRDRLIRLATAPE